MAAHLRRRKKNYLIMLKCERLKNNFKFFKILDTLFI